MHGFIAILLMFWLAPMPFMGWIIYEVGLQVGAVQEFGRRDAFVLWAVSTFNWPLLFTLGALKGFLL